MDSSQANLKDVAIPEQNKINGNKKQGNTATGQKDTKKDSKEGATVTGKKSDKSKKGTGTSKNNNISDKKTN